MEWKSGFTHSTGWYEKIEGERERDDMHSTKKFINGLIYFGLNEKFSFYLETLKGNCYLMLRETWFISKNGKPDIIITDPPRDGMHKKVIEQLLKILAKRIIYVSCNPATQARDIALLKEKYIIKDIQSVDMFPHTHHVENM